jgi:hypothetical protein
MDAFASTSEIIGLKDPGDLALDLMETAKDIDPYVYDVLRLIALENCQTTTLDQRNAQMAFGEAFKQQGRVSPNSMNVVNSIKNTSAEVPFKNILDNFHILLTLSPERQKEQIRERFDATLKLADKVNHALACL